MIKHLKIWQYAKLAQSKMRCLYKWCVAEKNATHLPLPCEDCSEWMSRLDKHLTTHKIFDLTTKIDQVQRSITRWKSCRQAGERSWVRIPLDLLFFEILVSAKLCVSVIIHSHLKNAKCFCFFVL